MIAAPLSPSETAWLIEHLQFRVEDASSELRDGHIFEALEILKSLSADLAGWAERADETPSERNTADVLELHHLEKIASALSLTRRLENEAELLVKWAESLAPLRYPALVKKIDTPALWAERNLIDPFWRSDGERFLLSPQRLMALRYMKDFVRLYGGRFKKHAARETLLVIFTTITIDVMSIFPGQEFNLAAEFLEAVRGTGQGARRGDLPPRCGRGAGGEARWPVAAWAGQAWRSKRVRGWSNLEH